MDDDLPICIEPTEDILKKFSQKTRKTANPIIIDLDEDEAEFKYEMYKDQQMQQKKRKSNLLQEDEIKPSKKSKKKKRRLNDEDDPSHVTKEEFYNMIGAKMPQNASNSAQPESEKQKAGKNSSNAPAAEENTDENEREEEEEAQEKQKEKEKPKESRPQQTVKQTAQPARPTTTASIVSSSSSDAIDLDDDIAVVAPQTSSVPQNKQPPTPAPQNKQTVSSAVFSPSIFSPTTQSVPIPSFTFIPKQTIILQPLENKNERADAYDLAEDNNDYKDNNENDNKNEDIDKNDEYKENNDNYNDDYDKNDNNNGDNDKNDDYKDEYDKTDANDDESSKPQKTAVPKTRICFQTSAKSDNKANFAVDLTQIMSFIKKYFLTNYDIKEESSGEVIENLDNSKLIFQCDGKVIDDYETFEELGVEEDDTVDVKVKGIQGHLCIVPKGAQKPKKAAKVKKQEKKKTSLFVQWSGGKQKVSLPDDYTILKLKEQFAKKFDLDKKKIMFLMDGEELDIGQTIGDLGVEDGDVLDMKTKSK